MLRISRNWSNPRHRAGCYVSQGDSLIAVFNHAQTAKCRQNGDSREDDMKQTLLGGIVLLVLVQITLYLREPTDMGVLSTPAPQNSPSKKSLLIGRNPPESTSVNIFEPRPVDKNVEALDERDQADRVINIGEPIYPDAPLSWSRSDNSEAINIGEPINPNDPFAWPQSDNKEITDIGYPIDPDDLSTWPQSEETEAISVGESMNPTDPYTWPQSEETKIIRVGETMYPDGSVSFPNR